MGEWGEGGHKQVIGGMGSRPGAPQWSSQSRGVEEMPRI